MGKTGRGPSSRNVTVSTGGTRLLARPSPSYLRHGRSWESPWEHAGDRKLPSPGNPCKSRLGAVHPRPGGAGGHPAPEWPCGSIPAPRAGPPTGASACHMSPAAASDWPAMTSPYFKAHLQVEGGVGGVGHADRDRDDGRGMGHAGDSRALTVTFLVPPATCPPNNTFVTE